MRNTLDNVNQKGERSDEPVLELVHSVMHAYRALQYRILRDGPHDITHMDSKVLGYFHRHPGATLSELADHSGRDKAQLAKLVKGLRDRGLLVAEVDPVDRRNVRLSLTADGEAVQRTLNQQAKLLSAKAVAGLTAKEREQLQMLLRRVQLNLKEPT